MMRIRVLVAVAAALSCMPAQSAGQGQAESDAGRAVPRMADGRPDLQGVWDYRTITPLERPESVAGREFLTPEEVADLEARALDRNTDEARPENAARDVSGAYNDFWWDRGQRVVPTGRTSLVVDPPDGRIPYLDRAANSRRTPRGYDGPESRNLWERCLTRALPRLSGAYNNNFQIVQSAGTVAVINEMIHEVRLIPIDGGVHADAKIRQWAGDSRGHWEGDTLVVDTTNFSDKTTFRGSGANLHLVERFTRTGEGTLLYEFTVDDTTAWRTPWTAEFPIAKNDALIYEYACHEGNYGMINLLRGARVQEREALLGTR
jgi:hypothetical protein